MLGSIQAVVEKDLRAMRVVFNEAAAVKVPMLRIILRYVLRNKGKQIRPLLVLLSAGLHGNIGKKAHIGGALAELVHQATLLHDDVVDGADERRGWLSVNAVWKNKIAVLAGDFLLSRALQLSIQHGEYIFLDIMCGVVTQMAEGELLQAQRARTQKINEQVYYDIIQKKTASLWGGCCKIGALSASVDVASAEQAAALGEALGMAFQIRDDLFDYDGANLMGKPLGIDLKERKLTLPLLRTLAQTSPSGRRALRRYIKQNDRKKVLWYMEQTDALAYTRAAMLGYEQTASRLLALYPPSPYREAFAGLVRYIALRQQ